MPCYLTVNVISPHYKPPSGLRRASVSSDLSVSGGSGLWLAAGIVKLTLTQAEAEYFRGKREVPTGQVEPSQGRVSQCEIKQFEIIANRVTRKLAGFSCSLLMFALFSSAGLLAADALLADEHNPVVDIAMWNPITCDCRRLSQIRTELQARSQPASTNSAELQRTADRLLLEPVWTVVDKSILPPSGDKHDYFSLATYYWPDPHSTNGLPYVSRDGKTNPKGNKYDNARLKTVAKSVYSLSLVFYLAGKEVYATKATQQIRAWFLDQPTRMNPHLEYAQVVKGIDGGSPFGIIDTRPLLMVVDAVVLLNEAKAWQADDEVRLQAWFRSYLEWLTTSRQGRRAADYDNNQGTWYDVQTATYALYCHQNQRAREILEAAKSRRIMKQIETDGRQPRELARSKSFTYSVSNLGALIRLARMGEQLGVDLWGYQSPDGRSIRQAVNYLAPYADPAKVWPYK